MTRVLLPNPCLQFEWVYASMEILDFIWRVLEEDGIKKIEYKLTLIDMINAHCSTDCH